MVNREERIVRTSVTGVDVTHWMMLNIVWECSHLLTLCHKFLWSKYILLMSTWEKIVAVKFQKYLINLKLVSCWRVIKLQQWEIFVKISINNHHQSAVQNTQLWVNTLFEYIELSSSSSARHKVFESCPLPASRFDLFQHISYPYTKILYNLILSIVSFEDRSQVSVVSQWSYYRISD